MRAIKYVSVSASLILMVLYSALSARAQKTTLEVGDKIPDFTLTDQYGKPFNSKTETGKQVLVIYFYPKDESMVCTKEACAFRDEFNEFEKAGARIIGINDGTVASHKSFTDHYKLPFTLFSDPGNKVYKLLGVKNKLFFTGRKTFIVDLKGKIVYTHEAMLEGKEHADDALAFIKTAKH